MSSECVDVCVRRGAAGLRGSLEEERVSGLVSSEAQSQRSERGLRGLAGHYGESIVWVQVCSGTRSSTITGVVCVTLEARGYIFCLTYSSGHSRDTYF